MRGVTSGMVLTAFAAVCGIATILGAGGEVAGAGVVALAGAHADAQEQMHRTFAALWDGLANNLQAIGVLSTAVHRLEGSDDVDDERDLA